MNTVTLFGRVGSDPELRFTKLGRPVLNLRLATSESYKDSAGELQERTEWHAITVWGPRAEGLARILKKGSQILVSGRLHSSSYLDKHGEKRFKTEVMAQSVELGARKHGAGRDVVKSEEAPAPEMNVATGDPFEGGSDDFAF
jgi:single-strand DNA-binding protein